MEPPCAELLCAQLVADGITGKATTGLQFIDSRSSAAEKERIAQTPLSVLDVGVIFRQ
jgi:hypothetical protein